MFYIAVGKKGRKIEDIEKEQGIENKYGIPFYEIIIDDKIVYLPEIFFFFWQNFQRKCETDIDTIKRSFVEHFEYLGLGAEEFDNALNALLKSGVIVEFNK